MYNVQISKRLETLFARSTFRIAKAKLTHSYEESLFLELLTSRSGVAYQFIWSELEDWQLFQLSLRVEGLITKGGVEVKSSPSEYFENYSRELCQKYPHVGRITTIHALHYILCDKASSLSKAAALYDITSEKVGERLSVMDSAESMNWGTSTSINSLPVEVKEQSGAKSHLLDKFGVELTRLAREGVIDPVVGRSVEIERVVDLLSRRKKSNPVLVGEAGVGKSAIVEGLALRIASGDVPPNLRGKRLYSLDISLLVAGTKFRGEFEERMQQLLEAIRSSKDIILFVDEIHTIVGAGSSQSSLDTANILKPALARGEIQTIGATTLSEYRDSIESDSALERRFQKVIIEPTSPAQTLEILRNIAPAYQEFHNVNYSAEALEACVALSNRYITDRFQPDNAIDLLDEAGARARRWSSSPMEQGRETTALVVGSDITAVAPQRVQLEITADHIREVVSSISGVPASRITLKERERLLGLKSYLRGRVIGQSRAIESLSNSILRSRAGLSDASRPVGVFMFVGATGVGKTLLAKELSRWLFDSPRGMIRIDMSEYSEPHSVARLIGSPPGYIGHGEGGELSEAVRRQSYSVVLFDEIEKAHPDILNVMLQIFDEGHLTDSAGRKVDFKNTIIIMTSNVGSTQISRRAKSVGYSTKGSDRAKRVELKSDYKGSIERRFSPELLNRIDDIVVFNSLTGDDIESIVELEFDKLRRRCVKLGYTLRLTPAARKRIAELGFESRYGARALCRVMRELLEEPLSQMILSGEVSEGGAITFTKSRIGDISIRV
ncbi:MAG: ATP-dependent Clp protease ATP-binding subunit [Rikenellaceae bacterium]